MPRLRSERLLAGFAEFRSRYGHARRGRSTQVRRDARSRSHTHLSGDTAATCNARQFVPLFKETRSPLIKMEPALPSGEPACRCTSVAFSSTEPVPASMKTDVGLMPKGDLLPRLLSIVFH